ncbi:hypothetical protein L1987_80864 [Smallanthus sonchifolius]|uniref:Uncharacterized protein n=1 Tax=Smallanthus sonchifolius TaxID=185202 RepID=A0ACB8YNY5_9ASTR|nr:hypothetical protein L1987_80864 [Smallanthus sonchifolius]
MSSTSNQVNNMNHLLNIDNEIGTPTKPPRLMNLKDYSNWKSRFENYVNINDTSLWIPISEGYEHHVHLHMGVSNTPKPISALNDDEKKLHDREKKALTALSMCLPPDIYHTFKKFKTSRELWEGLAKRCEGSTDIKKSRKELLKKQFSVFKNFDGESMEELMSRYYHLLSEMVNNDITYKNKKILEKFFDALPAHFEMYTIVIKEQSGFDDLSLEYLMEKVQSYDLHKQKKDTVYQDPSIYFGKGTSSSKSGGVSLFSESRPMFLKIILVKKIHVLLRQTLDVQLIARMKVIHVLLNCLHLQLMI